MGFYKIWSGDYSNEGYEDGFKDGQQGKSKNKLKFIVRLNPINLFWAFNEALKSYNDSYNMGYRDGQRVRHGVFSSNIATGNNIGYDSYRRQVELLREALNNLNALKNYLNKIEEDYKNLIERAQSEGFMKEYVDTLRSKYSKFKKEIEQLKELINKHQKKLENQKKELETISRRAIEG